MIENEINYGVKCKDTMMKFDSDKVLSEYKENIKVYESFEFV